MLLESKTETKTRFLNRFRTQEEVREKKNATLIMAIAIKAKPIRNSKAVETSDALQPSRFEAIFTDYSVQMSAHSTSNSLKTAKRSVDPGTIEEGSEKPINSQHRHQILCQAANVNGAQGSYAWQVGYN